MSQVQSAHNGSMCPRWTKTSMGTNVTGREGQNWTTNTWDELSQFGLNKIVSGFNS
jgi:hypothetical protein